MSRRIKIHWLSRAVILALVLTVTSVQVIGQKKSTRPKPRPTPAKPQSELDKLRDQYISATKEYKASLEKLRALYQQSVLKAEQQHDRMKKLLEQGLISKHELEQSETAVADAKLKVNGVENQISGADAQIAQALVEVEGDKEIAKLGKIPRGTIVRTGSFIRFTGAGSWVLSQAGRIESFFQLTFKRPLPIAVFGQGAIHNQWRLDHRNAMDISLHPDGPEGQALIEFMRQNGIPFSAFRGAIPGVATGPHIHIGMPSHRY
jgi:multidrug efflux pump subunit AcrA (membrane-fusion protein)